MCVQSILGAVIFVITMFYDIAIKTFMSPFLLLHIDKMVESLELSMKESSTILCNFSSYEILLINS